MWRAWLVLGGFDEVGCWMGWKVASYGDENDSIEAFVLSKRSCRDIHLLVI